jgi:hypothetical protein
MAPRPNFMYMDGIQPFGMGIGLRRRAQEKASNPNKYYNTTANFAAPRPYVSEKAQHKKHLEEEKADKRILKAKKAARQLREKESRGRGKQHPKKGSGCVVM